MGGLGVGRCIEGAGVEKLFGRFGQGVEVLGGHPLAIDQHPQRRLEGVGGVGPLNEAQQGEHVTGHLGLAVLLAHVVEGQAQGAQVYPHLLGVAQQVARKPALAALPHQNGKAGVGVLGVDRLHPLGDQLH